jgi:hypothetical protein
MSDCRFKHYIPATGKDGVNTVKVSVYYSKGGINYFNYQNEPSAIWASLTPMKVESRDGMSTEQYIMGKGLKVNLEAATRLNRKNVEKAFERVLAEITVGAGQVWEAIQEVCKRQEVTLQTEVHSTEAAKA